MGVFASIVRRRRAVASVASVTAATLVLTTMAVLYQGVTTADVDLNDAGVWVTQPSALLAGRLNYPSEVLDAGLYSKGESFDVVQEAGTVLLHDRSGATVSVVNTSTVTLDEDVPVPAGSTVALGGGVVAILEPGTGKLWVRAADAVESFNVASDEPVVELGADAVATVAPDGTVFAYSAVDTSLTTVVRGGSAKTTPVREFAANARVAVSAVGETPVLLDTVNGFVSLGGAAPIDLGSADGLILQEPSSGGDAVAIATNHGLAVQPLDGSSVRSIDAGGTGVAVTPVVVNGCTYAAWTGSGRYVRDCAGTANDASRGVDALAGDTSAVFRVNRGAVVLNDLTEGLVWLVNQNMKEVSNWEDVTPPTDESNRQDQDAGSQDQIENTIPDRAVDNNPPIAQDDTLGVRAGRSIILPILDNDTDPDGDVLTAEVLGTLPPIGEVEPIYGGAALQIRVDDDATGTASFTYRASDGRGLSDDAAVTITVTPEGRNTAPIQNREARVVVERGASVSYNVLADWGDPDGDDLFLTSASVSSDDQVQSRDDGLVTFDAVGAEEGRKDVTIIVSDGEEKVQGVLHMDVRAPGTISPIANPDHVTTHVGQATTVAPLSNDSSPSGGRLMLAEVSGVGDADVVPDYNAGTVRFTASIAKTYYLQYRASDGPNYAIGLVRVDVLPATSDPQPPVAVRDVALLPAGGDVLVDVLQNDSDPSGGILVVQSVAVQPAAGVAVAILEHAVLRVTDQTGIGAPVTFTYTVSNGTDTAMGEVLVVSVPAPAVLEPPIAADDHATVRAGDTVTIDVLSNDVSPTGDLLAVVPDLVAPLPEAADGVAFVSQDTVRFQAGENAETVHLTYEAADSSGQKDAGYISIQVLPMNRETNSPPRPANLEARALAGTTIRIPVPLDGIDPDGDSVTLAGQSGAPSKGRIDEVGDTYLTYTAFEDSSGTDTFRYEVRDALGATNAATIRVGVAPRPAVNQAPDAVKDVVTARPGRRIAVDVLGNDTDPDGDTLSLVEDEITVPRDVTARVSSGRVLVTVPEAEGDHALQYTVTDTRGATAIGSLLVSATNEAEPLAPIARDDTVTAAQIGEAATVDVPVLNNDEDPDGVASELDVALIGAPVGAVAAAGVVTVTPTDTPQVIAYTATDADQRFGTAFIRVPALTSTGPSIRPGSVALEVKAGEQATIPLSDYVVAPEGKSVRLTQADRVSAIHSADGVLVKDETTLLYTSQRDYFGSDALTFEVTDGAGPDDPAGVKATLSIPITVLPPDNQPPTFSGGAMRVAPGEAATTLDLRALSADPDKGDLEKLSYTVTGGSDGISASVSGSILSASAERSAAKGTTATLAVTVSDGTTAPVQGSVIVTVSASTRPLAVANDDIVAKAPQGRPTAVSVLSNDVNPFPGTPLTLVGTPTVDAGTGVPERVGDTIVVTPEPSFVGTLVVRYQVADATQDPERYVFGVIRLTVQGKPAAPGTPSVSAVQDRTVVLSWSDGSNNGSAITTHTAKWNGGSQDCAATTCSITGLTNGTEYTFTVTATNEVGESDPSAPSAVARPDARPSAPTITDLDYGDGSLTVTWADAAVTTGSAIAEYEIQVSGENQPITVAAPAHTKELTGLTNGSTYTISVRAKNKAPLPSDWSGSMSMSPAGSPGAPDAPTVGAAVDLGSQSQLPVSWTPPADKNAEDLTGYILVTKLDGQEVGRKSYSPSESPPLNIDVQYDAAAYTFSVAATNKSTDAGKTEPVFSADSAPRRAVGRPGRLDIVSAGEGDNAIVDLRWTDGGGNGATADELSYYYDLNGDGVERPAQETITDGIANNGSYTVRVRAVSTVDGTPTAGDWSLPTDVLRPFGSVQAPTVTASGGATNVTFDWSAPAPNGRAIQTMLISIDGADWKDVGPGGGSQSVGTGYSETHSIRVKAVDSDGRESGEASAQDSSGPQPAIDATASWQGNAGLSGNCTSGDCPFADVSVSNATPNQSYTIVWYCRAADAAAECGDGNEITRTTRQADGSGDFSADGVVYFGFHGTVWATVYGDRGPVNTNDISR